MSNPPIRRTAVPTGRRIKCGIVLLLVGLATSAHAAEAARTPNVILFVPDGLRSQIVDERTAPTFERLRREGVDFTNSHSLFPTFTTPNASAFATGHGFGDTGTFGNYLYAGFGVQSANGSTIPFIESDPVLRELQARSAGTFIDAETLVAAVRGRFSTALVGKLGPVAMFDPASLDEARADRTLIVDDSTGTRDGAPLSQEWLDAIKAAGVKVEAPGRGDNANAGSNKVRGTFVANLAQQQYFLEMTLKVILPAFKARAKPFVLVYWSRDPDGTQHNQGDSFGSLSPGINGPTSLSAIRGADGALAAIEQQLKALDLYDTTDIVVAADHGFSTVSKQSATSPAARLNTASDTDAGALPFGFLAVDLAIALRTQDPALKLFDPDDGFKEVPPGQHPKRGNGIIARLASAPLVIVAANGGSDLLYFPERGAKTVAALAFPKKLAQRVAAALLDQDYVSGLFVNTARTGVVPGALALQDIGLIGTGKTPVPDVLVNFRSAAIRGCARPIALCTAIIADAGQQQGQGMHGSFARSDTFNFMAARGPDFRRGFADPLPASNADIGRTLARLLGVADPATGPLAGRVLDETLNTQIADAPLPIVTRRTLASTPGNHGLRTLLETQTVNGHTYYTTAGFAGRTAGLEAPDPGK